MTVREQLRRLMNKFKVPRTSSEGMRFLSGLVTAEYTRSLETHSDLLGMQSPVFKLFQFNILDVRLAQVIQM